jgi:hypothetical protein
MTVEEIKGPLPEVLTDVRAWCGKVNDLPERSKLSLVRQHQTRKDRARWGQAVFSNSSRPISMRLISLVPAPIS